MSAQDRSHGLPDIAGQAAAAGYVKRVDAHCSMYDLTGYVRDDAELDGVFTLIDEETGEQLQLHGWLWIVEPADEGG